MLLSLAPMAAVTHLGFRRLVSRFFPPHEFFAEMIHAPSLVAGGLFEKWYLRTCKETENLVWQLTSNDVHSAAKAVPEVLSCGGIGIDLNMGCCAPHIVNSGAGIAWMKKNPAETAFFVRSTKKAILSYAAFSDTKPVRLSVKLRLGAEENYRKLLNFVKMLVDEGVELITLHPRVQKQKYSRPAKHCYTAMLAADLSIPVFGNGDIDSAEKLKNLMEKYPCAGWMIGRAAIRKPWIFLNLASYLKKEGGAGDFSFSNTADSADLLETAFLFLQFLQEEQPEEFWLTRAQRFFAYYCDNFTFAHHIKTKILNSSCIDEMKQKLSAYIDEVPSDRIVKI